MELLLFSLMLKCKSLDAPVGPRQTMPLLAMLHDDKGRYIYPEAPRTMARLGPCCRLGRLALLLSLWKCEAPVTDGRDILQYLLPFRSDVQYVPFPADDRGEPAAVHPSPPAPRHPPPNKSSPAFQITTMASMIMGN